jgi:cytochrome c-type biogenesis protein CcmF
MNLGIILIVLSFATALAAGYLFIQEEKRAGLKKHPGQKALSVRFFYLTTGLIIAASLLLYYFLLEHQFQYSYVARYSSSSLELLYIISAFWAGQEGTFLFWALLAVVMGLLFWKKTHDRYAMAAVSFFTAFLSLLMIVKSPFEFSNPVPHDGQGMNPLLQDPWMAIHPPILFIGYAATVFPFGLVVSGLARRNYANWNTFGFRWALFSAFALGAGIIIGGFWAYEVLGWGGYWGWDPVENSSLVPWLTLLALVHGLIVQKGKGSLVRTNMLLAIVTFFLVLYATFLTRSGVLADFSVHSFENLGINGYLIGSLVATCVVGFGLFIARFRTITSPKVDVSSFNRELSLLIGIFVLCASALFVFAGMSSPIITGLFGKASQVDTSFYNKVNLPIAIVMGALLGFTPFLRWKEDDVKGLLKRLSLPLVLTALSVVISYVAGVTSALLLTFIGAAMFGVIANAITTFRQYRSGWLSLGGPIGHVGVGLMFVGIIGSTKFDESKQVILREGVASPVGGYTLTYQGIIPPANENQKPALKIEVSDGQTTYLATPHLYYSNYSQSMMREPSIKIYPLKDLYLSPLELHTDEGEHQHAQADHPQMELIKGETKAIGNYEISFGGFDMTQHENAQAMVVGASLRVKFEGKEEAIVPQLMFAPTGERQSVPKDLPGLNRGSYEKPQVLLTAVSVEEKKVVLEFHGLPGAAAPAQAPPQAAELLLDVSTKPLMMVVWTGVVLMIAGTLIAFIRRLSTEVID